MNKLRYSALLGVLGWYAVLIAEPTHLFRIKAATKEKRTELANLGLALEGVNGNQVLVYGADEERKVLEKNQIEFEVQDLKDFDLSNTLFPSGDGAFHDYKETNLVLENLVKKEPSIASLFSIGNSLEGRAIRGIRLSRGSKDSLPSALFLGCHHAREHLSVEIPLMLAEYLVNNYKKSKRIQKILASTEIYIVPMVNPDGAEYDIASSRYKMWRKNRRPNKDGTFGVDLNRNYGKSWGGPGSSGSTSSETYRGPHAFSEPETQAVRDFIIARKRATVLLTYHTFSELILWPYGFTYSDIPIEKDKNVFEILGKTMSQWNRYTPRKASELYLASGDTTDWAYAERKLFAFTFELSPKSMFKGGFYPGAKAIAPTFKANLEPALYLMEKAQNPYSVLLKK